ncbi:MAG: hypothetical protein J0L92_30930 [Deltaproteobacteria bacterium]|nr:hypothetical protein [Deltaproteobacteria bacterium]
MARLASLPRMPRATGALTALAMLAIAGCPNGGGDIALEDVPAPLAPTYCALFDRCGNPFVDAAIFAGRPCEDAIEPILEDALLGQAAEAVREGTVVYHGERVDDCIAALDAVGCTISDLGASACTDVFEGTVAAGGDCAWDEECVVGYCSTADGMCPGTCAARIPEGSACPSGQGCEIGTSCATGTCRAVSNAGGPCAGPEGRSCSGLDLTCVGATAMTPGTCRPFMNDGEVGDACSIADDLCREGLSCIFAGVEGGMARFECAEAVAAGAACSRGYPDQCPDDQFCDTDVCRPLPTEGQPCTAECLPGLRCVVATGASMGECTAPARLGEPCEGNQGCVSSRCEDGVCATAGC